MYRQSGPLHPEIRHMPVSLQEAVSAFGRAAKSKLSNPAASGAPEDQLRAPLEALIPDLAELAGLHPGNVVMVGETSLADIKTRPDYAVTRGNALTGFIEIKAPGKGADPRRFRDPHDQEQWTKLQTLPNLIYTDGNAFSLWRNGSLEGDVVRLEGDVETAGAKLAAPDRLLSLFASFFEWEPEPPRSARELAGTSARLCRLLREEVTEQLGRGSPSLTNLATDWRKLLFPSATDEAFADGYAQAVTFGLLMARAREIVLADGLDRVARELRNTNTLIGTALRLLTDDADSETALKTSLATLTRVLDAVDWPAVAKGNPDAWLYFYEDFLSVYDNDLRKKTGSYYTPPEVVRAMVRLVDEALRSGSRFALSEGLASPEVTVADPATGTGTFLLGVLSRIAQTTADDQGPGAVPAVIEATISRLIGFEIQFGPFAVAQLRLLAELHSLLGDPSAVPATRLYVTDTLGNPYAEEEYLPQILMPLGESRRRANAIKRQEKITVVIGNPPYKERAKGLGGWIESGSTAEQRSPHRSCGGCRQSTGTSAPMPSICAISTSISGGGQPGRSLGTVVGHEPTVLLQTLTETAARHGPTDRAHDRRGIVAFITVAGFLNGPGFQKMRAELRREADELWIIDCSPEGHQPEVPTRIFQGVQQPVCIVMALRSTDAGSVAPGTGPIPGTAARTPNRQVRGARRDHAGRRRVDGMPVGPTRPRSSRGSAGAWGEFPALRGPVRLRRLWCHARADLGDRTRSRFARATVGGASIRSRYREEGGAVPSAPAGRRARRQARPQTATAGAAWPRVSLQPSCFGHRSRRPARPVRPPLLRSAVDHPRRAGHQSTESDPVGDPFEPTGVHDSAAPHMRSSAGPAVTFSAADTGSGPLQGVVWRSSVSALGRARAPGAEPQGKPAPRSRLKSLGVDVGAPDLMAYLAAVAAHPAYTARFRSDLVQPGLRIPSDRRRLFVRGGGRDRARDHLAPLLRRALRGPRCGTTRRPSAHYRRASAPSSRRRAPSRSGPDRFPDRNRLRCRRRAA